MRKKAIGKVVIKALDFISDVLDSPKFTVFWMSLLLASVILGVLINLITKQ